MVVHDRYDHFSDVRVGFSVDIPGRALVPLAMVSGSTFIHAAFFETAGTTLIPYVLIFTRSDPFPTG